MFRRRVPIHEHRWISVSSNASYVRNFIAVTGKPTQMEVTLVLQRCRCGAHNTTQVEGKWSREELGIDDRTVSDLLALLNETEPHNGSD